MKKEERNKLLKKYSAYTDGELKDEYFGLLYNDVLGSEAELMEDVGYETIDIKERRLYEKWADEVTDIIEGILLSRGIDVWKITNADHRKQRGRTAPNRALDEEK